MASSCSRFAAFLLIAIAAAGCCVNAQSDVPTTAMFVFGDSYADTGNCNNNSAASWQDPYGETWPGKPAGRFSDGKILTDFIASNLSIETPEPHANWSSHNMSCDGFSSGVNFAHGGTGILTTFFEPEGPTLSCQIDQFEMMSNDCPNIKSLIGSSLVLVSMVGNDYITYLLKHQHDSADLQDLLAFMGTIVNGTGNSIIRLYNIGFRKFAIANLEPAGCIPRFVSPDNNCNFWLDAASYAHNAALLKQVGDIQYDRPDMQYLILDHYSYFKNAQENQFDKNFHACINVTANTLCPDPSTFFFWDDVHPTQAGWKAVTDLYMEEVCKLVGSCNEQSVGFE